jgi:hypothetical protein
MEYSSLQDADTCSASQKIPLILWNPKIYRHVQNNPPVVPILSQSNPIHAPLFHYLHISPSGMMTSTGSSPKSWFHRGSTVETLHAFIFSVMRATYLGTASI